MGSGGRRRACSCSSALCAMGPLDKGRMSHLAPILALLPPRFGTVPAPRGRPLRAALTLCARVCAAVRHACGRAPVALARAQAGGVARGGAGEQQPGSGRRGWTRVDESDEAE